MRSNYDAIHFDMDGVLADTEPFHVAAELQTCRDYGFDIDPTQWEGFKGRTAEDIFSYLIQTYGNPAVQTTSELIAHKTDVFINLLTGKLTPIPGSLEFLDWVRQSYPKVSLVTSSNKRVQQFIINTFGIADIFDTVVTGDDITEGKPSPQPYLTAIDKLGVSGLNSLVIEDSRSGVLSGLAAGCDVLAITTSHGREELITVNPTYIVDDYANARSTIENKKP